MPQGGCACRDVGSQGGVISITPSRKGIECLEVTGKRKQLRRWSERTIERHAAGGREVSGSETSRHATRWFGYSKSVGSLNITVSLMLPWPYCGKFVFVRFAGSSVDAVSSGGNNTSEFRNAMTAL